MDSKKSLHGPFNIYPGVPERFAEIAENYLTNTARAEKWQSGGATRHLHQQLITSFPFRPLEHRQR